MQTYGQLSKNDYFLTKFGKDDLTDFSKVLRDLSADPAYKEWLYDNKHPLYARSIINHSSRVLNLIFSDEFVLRTNNSKKQNDMRVMGNLCRYHDIKYDTNLHEQFTAWSKKKEIKWNVTTNRNNYHIASQILLSDVLSSIDNLPLKYKIFGLFVLTTGLRTEESIMSSNSVTTVTLPDIIMLIRQIPLRNNIIDKGDLNSRFLIKIGFPYISYRRFLNYTITAKQIIIWLKNLLKN